MNDEGTDNESSDFNPSEYAEVPGKRIHPCSPKDAVQETESRSDELLKYHSAESSAPNSSSGEFSSISRERLQTLAQAIVEEVNRKRQKDSEMLDDYKSAQISQVESFCSRAESHLFDVYKVQNKYMQDKLQELFDTLDRISKLETELQEFRAVLNNLYKDIMSS